VTVPRHWCFKRKYLQGKRGIEKPPFDLPDFIKATGIMEMRQALQEKEDQKTLKAKMRERVRPKMGKIDIDYQKLHDAFFKWQTKPKMSIHGDLYYEVWHDVQLCVWNITVSCKTNAVNCVAPYSKVHTQLLL